MTQTKYLGEVDVDVVNHPKYSKFQPSDWAMLFITKYGQIDGEHHKSWVLDQVARILKGTPVIVRLASWANGEKEYRFWLDNPNDDYVNWVIKMKGDYIKTADYEGFEYDYYEGIPP